VDIKQLWENTLVNIELNISKANFSTWFKSTSIQKMDVGVVYLNVPNQFVKDWLTTKYHKDILKTLRSFSSEVRGLEYTISKEQKGSLVKNQTIIKQFNQHEVGELPLDDFYINHLKHL